MGWQDRVLVRVLPSWDSAPVEHPAWAACPSGSAPPAWTGPRWREGSGSWLGLEAAACQGQWGWTEPGALVLGQPRTLELRGCPAPSVQGCSHHPGMWGELAQPQSPRLYVRMGYREMRSLCPKQQPFRGSQEKLPGGKSPSGSGPPRSRGAACAHAGRRCHRSGSGGERWGQAQGAAVFPQPRLPSKSNIVGTRQAPCAGSAYTGLS